VIVALFRQITSQIVIEWQMLREVNGSFDSFTTETIRAPIA
jgi:hypothetical protein